MESERLFAELPAKLPDFPSRFGKPQSLTKQVEEQAEKRSRTDKERGLHRRRKAGIGAAHNHGLRMLRPPPANGQGVERDIRKADDSSHGVQQRRPAGIDKETAHQQISHEKQPKDEGERQARIPSPPDAPDGFRPQWPGN